MQLFRKFSFSSLLCLMTCANLLASVRDDGAMVATRDATGLVCLLRVRVDASVTLVAKWRGGRARDVAFVDAPLDDVAMVIAKVCDRCHHRLLTLLMMHRAMVRLHFGSSRMRAAMS